MTKLQNKLLDMVKWFHNFCQENNLRYYALGGTMLGAARHQGFIPWDDDIDVGMPRKDYEKLIMLCKVRKNEQYILESINSENKDYIYGYAKIYDTSTTLIERARVNVRRGIYIDIFPLDGVGNNENKIKSIFNPIYYRYQFIVARTCALNKERKLYKNILMILARMIPEVFISNKKIIIDIDKLCKKNDYDSCEIIGNLLGNWGIKEIMPKDYMGEPTLYKFEDTYIYGAEKYDLYLKKLYGDWHKLPPKEKRITHHDAVECDLEKSFLNKNGI